MTTIVSADLPADPAERKLALADALSVLGFLGGWRKQGVPPGRHTVVEIGACRFLQVRLPVRPSRESIAACAGVLGLQSIAVLYEGDQLWRIFFRDGAAMMGAPVPFYPVVVPGAERAS